MEVTHLLCLFDPQLFKEQHFPGEIKIAVGDLPVPITNVALADLEMSAFVQFAKEAPTEVDVIDQIAVHALHAIGRRIDIHVPRHSLEHLRLTVRWIETRVRTEPHFHYLRLIAGTAELIDECIRHRSNDTVSSAFVCFLFLQSPT